MGDFADVSASLKEVFKEIGVRWWLKPRVLIHLIPKADGGYTKVELRAFREAAEIAGAGRVFLLTDHAPVSDAELGKLFP